MNHTVKIKDAANYAKDTVSKAIINCDDTAYAHAKRSKEAKRLQTNTLDYMTKQIQILQSRCDVLEKAVAGLTNK